MLRTNLLLALATLIALGACNTAELDDAPPDAAFASNVEPGARCDDVVPELCPY